MKASLSTIVLCICLFTYTNIQAQNFEGVIIYDFSYKDKTGYFSPKEIKKLLGDRQIYYYKSGKYRSRLNGKWEKSSVYLGGDKICNTKKHIRAIMWVDAEKQPNEVLSYKITRDAKKIKGWRCDLLEVKTEEGTLYYYYHPKLSVDPKMYSSHHYRFLSYCISKTGALPIKFIYESELEYLEIVAEDINEKLIEEDVFELPAGLPEIKDPDWAKLNKGRK